MKVTATEIADVLVIEPRVFSDSRGFFYETFNRREFEKLGIQRDFVQDNQSFSTKGVLRGLHYQVVEPQGKLVRAVSGTVFDVAVDIRRSSRTFGHWVGEFLSGSNKKMLWIPEGFAHGFAVLSDSAEVAYKVTNFYAPQQERTIKWDDPDLGIQWDLPDMPPIISAKDAEGVHFRNAEVFE